MIPGLIALSACASIPARSPAVTAPSHPLPERLGGNLLLGRSRAVTPVEYLLGMGEGSAPFFALDLKEAAVFEYMGEKTGDPALSVTILTLASDMEAFGFYDALRRRAGEEGSLTTLPFAYRTGKESVFYKGRRVVRIGRLREAAVAPALIEELSRRIAAMSPGRAPLPEVEALADAGASPADVRWEGSRVLDAPELAPALVAEIPLSSAESVRIHLTAKADPREAEEDFDAYLRSKSGGAKGIAFTIGVGDVACTLWDETYGWIDLSRKDRYIVSAAGFREPGAGMAAITRVISKLGK